jgi:hypothetical protein
MALAGLVGSPPTAYPVAAQVLADEGAMDVSENERGVVHVQGDDGRGYDENVMTMRA